MPVTSVLQAEPETRVVDLDNFVGYTSSRPPSYLYRLKPDDLLVPAALTRGRRSRPAASPACT